MADIVTITTPWRLPASTYFASNGSPVRWSNRDNIRQKDGEVSSAVFGSAPPYTQSEYLVAYNFGFSIPSNAVVEGIEVRIRAAGVPALLANIELFRDGPYSLEYTSSLGATPLNAALADYVFGGPTTNPGNFTAGNINRGFFGVRFTAVGLNAQVDVDSVEIRVYYHIPAEPALAGTISATPRVKNVVPPPPFESRSFAGTAANENGGFNRSWGSIEQAIGEPDSNFAVSARIAPRGSGTANDAPTDYLNLKGYSLSIPSIATLKQIWLRVNRAVNSPDSQAKLVDHTISLLRDGARVGPNKAASGQLPTTPLVQGYLWTGSDLDEFTADDLAGPNFGASLQYYSTTDSPAANRVRVDWAEIRVEWDIFKGTISAVGNLEPAPLTIERIVSGSGSAAATSGAMGALSVQRLIEGEVTAELALDEPLLGLRHHLVGTSAVESAATGDLTIGVPQPLAGNTSAAFDLAAATMTVLYRLAGTISNPTVVKPATMTVVSIASVSGFRRRFVELLPPWFGDSAPLVEALLAGLVSTAIHGFRLVRFADLQARIRTASGGFLDLISGDFFGETLPRREGETDEAFRTRIRNEIFRERATRRGLSKAIEDLVGKPPRIIEPQRPADTGAYGVASSLGYGVAGAWGSRHMDYQAFVSVELPSSVGIPFVGGYGVPVFGYSVGGQGMWAPSEPLEGALTAEDVYAVIKRNKPVGTLLWVNVR